MSELPVLPSVPALPCWPCPHGSACCSWGSTLSDQEAAAIADKYGPHLIYRTRWGEWRTRVRDRRCVFLQDNGCRIHADPFYPEVCRGFPWFDAETGGPYAFDQTICPAIAAEPALIAQGRLAAEARRRTEDA